MASRIPAALKRTKSGYYRAWIAREWRYFGKDEADAVRLYGLALAEQPRTGMTVAQLVVLAMNSARERYRPCGRWGGEAATLKYALRFLDTTVDLPTANGKPHRVTVPSMSVDHFGAPHLRAVRQQMIDDQKSRGYINAQIKRIVRAFEDARTMGWVKRETVDDLRCLRPLREGQANVKDRGPVGSVSDANVDAILPHLSDQMLAIVQVLRHTGMRVGELLSMRVGMLDTSNDVWLFDLGTAHKTGRGGRSKRVAIGPKAQALVRPWLQRAMSQRATHAPVWPAISKRCGLDTVAVASVNDAIEIACGKAGVERFTTHQLRHAKATRLVESEVLNAVRAVLGHASESSSRVYAELDSVACELARKSG